MRPVSVPISRIEPVTDVLHGVPVTDPYRWLEDQNSPETRAWIEEQTRYARAYLDNLPGRDRIRERVRELLDVETYDSFLKTGNRYFFRKRMPGQEQPCIYFREGPEGEDQLLVDPASRGTGDYTAVKPLRVSPNGSLLLYEVKQGGERMGTFEILDVLDRRILPDSLPHGYLRGFTFAEDAKSFYFVHEATHSAHPFHRAVFHHVLGTKSAADREIFCAGEDPKLRLILIAGENAQGFLVNRFQDRTYTDFYIWRTGSTEPPVPVLRDAEYSFSPRLLSGRILAAIDQDAPNRRIVEVHPRKQHSPLYLDLVPESDAFLRNWAITANHIVVSYVRGTRTQLSVFDRFGNNTGQIPVREGETVRIAASNCDDDELLLERESFTHPIEIVRCATSCGTTSRWSLHSLLPLTDYRSIQTSFPSRDKTSIPLYIVALPKMLAGGTHPAVMTSYGGYGVSSTPQFSMLASFLIEHGCLFALPSIRGGSEFGAKWHEAARARNRQIAFNDFLAAAEWLVATGRTVSDNLAILGGSNSGLLVAAAMTQRPDLFGAVLCMVPITDMLRYHLFDSAYVWVNEFGVADDEKDFQALRSYSPYHAIQDHTSYPPTLVISGDADRSCNALHARKFIARLQEANVSKNPVLLDYTQERGHSPTLPLTTRINALTDRLAFLCCQLGVNPGKDFRTS